MRNVVAEGIDRFFAHKGQPPKKAVVHHAEPSATKTFCSRKITGKVEPQGISLVQLPSKNFTEASPDWALVTCQKCLEKTI